VRLIVGEGLSIEQAAARALGKPSVRDVEYIGRRFRESLTELANLWHPVSKGSRIRSHVEVGAKPVAGAEGMRSIEGRTAHASGHAVRYSERTDADAANAATGAS
jgi:hypothetical protein